MMQTSEAATVPTSQRNPSPSSLQHECVPTNHALYNNPDIYGPWCATAASGGTCPGPICKWNENVVAINTGTRVAKPHSFLGTNLVQSGTVVDLAYGSFDEL